VNEKKALMTTHIADAQARAERDLRLLEAEITVARRRLDELRRKQGELRAAVPGHQPHPPADMPDGLGAVYTSNTVAGVFVSATTVNGELVISVGRFDPAAAGTLSVDPRSGTATLVLAVADENGDTTRLGQRSYLDLYPDPAVVSGPPGQEAQQ
jgi:hypothetical protein